MIAKLEEEKLYVFNKSTGITSVFSHNELNILKNYVFFNEKNEFIARLYELGVLEGEDCKVQKIITEALQKSTEFSLKALHVELTNKCPLACPQCYKGDAKPVDIDIGYLESIINEAMQLKVMQIAFGGGEPLLYPHLLQAIRIVNDTSMSVSLTSSGFSLNSSLLKQLLQAGLNHMQISLNAIDEEINSLSRSGYKDAVFALELLKESGMSFGVNWVARKDNVKQFGALVDYARKIGADNINVLRYKPTVLEDYHKNALDTAETKNIADALPKVSGVKIKVDSAYSQLLYYLHADNTDPLQSGCGAGRIFIAVTPDEMFKPCSHLSLQLKSTSIKEYLYSEQVKGFLQTKNNLTGLCGDCKYESGCSGCRAICENLTGDILSGEQECIAFIDKGAKI